MSEPRRRVRYSVATSLDGFIAGPDGAFDWIVMDPDIDFEAMGSEFDTLLVGRKTFEVMQAAGDEAEGAGWPGMKIYVFSSTLRREDHPGVTIVASDAAAKVAERLRVSRGPGTRRTACGRHPYDSHLTPSCCGLSRGTVGCAANP